MFSDNPKIKTFFILILAGTVAFCSFFRKTEREAQSSAKEAVTLTLRLEMSPMLSSMKWISRTTGKVKSALLI